MALTVTVATPSSSAVTRPLLDTLAMSDGDASHTKRVSFITDSGCPDTVSCMVAPGSSLTLDSESMMYLRVSPIWVLSMTSTRHDAEAALLSFALAVMNAEPVFSCGMTATMLPDEETITTFGSELSQITSAPVSFSVPRHTVAVMDWRALSARSYERYVLSSVSAVIVESTFSAFSTTVTLTLKDAVPSETVTIASPASRAFTVNFLPFSDISTEMQESEDVARKAPLLYVAG